MDDLEKITDSIINFGEGTEALVENARGKYEVELIWRRILCLQLKSELILAGVEEKK